MASRSLAEEQFLLIGENGLIGYVLRVVRSCFAALLHGGQHSLLEQTLLLEKLLLITPGRLGCKGHFDYSFEIKTQRAWTANVGRRFRVKDVISRSRSQMIGLRCTMNGSVLGMGIGSGGIPLAVGGA